MTQTVLVVDARIRELEVFTASATQLPGQSGRLVLRKGASIGKLPELAGRELLYPTMVVGSYQAKSSAGFVSLIGAANRDQIVWVGGAGFGITEAAEGGGTVRKGYGLRPFGRQLCGSLLPGGTRLEKVETHRNSNCATASAAMTALEFQCEINRRRLIVAEGQSDYTSGYAFDVPEHGDLPEFPQEHREDIFSGERMFEAAIRRLTKGDERAKAVALGRIMVAMDAGKGPCDGELPSTLLMSVGAEELERLVREHVAALEEGETAEM